MYVFIIFNDCQGEPQSDLLLPFPLLNYTTNRVKVSLYHRTTLARLALVQISQYLRKITYNITSVMESNLYQVDLKKFPHIL